MFVSSRKLNETIKIGETVEVSVVEISKDFAKLKVTVPDDVAIVCDDDIAKKSSGNKCGCCGIFASNWGGCNYV